MFLIAKLHPRLEETEQADYDGLWLNREASKTIIKRFYATKQELPLCIDHRGGSQTGYVKGEDRVGRVSDLFLNKEGELMVKCELFNHHQQGYKEVNQGIFRNKERWGVSVGLVNVNDPVTGKKRSSNLVHVALTNDPAFGAQGTYLTEWALSEEGIDKILSTKYADAEFSPQLSAKLEGMLIFYFLNLHPRIIC